jgi:hypothetical protein
MGKVSLFDDYSGLLSKCPEDALNNEHMQAAFMLFSLIIECTWKYTNVKSKLVHNLRIRGERGVLPDRVVVPLHVWRISWREKRVS